MSRCEATTRKGTRCRNDAMEGSRFCGVHRDQAGRSEPGGREEGAGSADVYDFMEELGETTRTILGVAAVGLAVLVALRLGRRC